MMMCVVMYVCVFVSVRAYRRTSCSCNGACNVPGSCNVVILAELRPPRTQRELRPTKHVSGATCCCCCCCCGRVESKCSFSSLLVANISGFMSGMFYGFGFMLFNLSSFLFSLAWERAADGPRLRACERPISLR